jgi:hypothetical protein
VGNQWKDGRMDTIEHVTEVTMEDEVVEIEERHDEIVEGHDYIVGGVLEALQNTKLSTDEGASIFFKIPKLRKINPRG